VSKSTTRLEADPPARERESERERGHERERVGGRVLSFSLFLSLSLSLSAPGEWHPESQALSLNLKPQTPNCENRILDGLALEDKGPDALTLITANPYRINPIPIELIPTLGA